MSPNGRQRPPVVTISASYGAGGSVIGPRLAERLSVPFIDRAIPVEVSQRLEMPLEEAIAHEGLPHRTLSRWAAFFVPAAQIWTGAPTGIPTPAEEEEFRRMTEEVLAEYAQRGGVILGRAAALILRDVPGALHVRLHGPPERRVLQAMQVRGIDRETAERDLRAADLAREAYVRHWYRADPNDPLHYHLMIDSTSVSIDGCIDLICSALRCRVPVPVGPG